MKKVPWLLPAALLLIGLAVIAACGDDDSGSDGATPADGSPADASPTDDADASPSPTATLTTRPLTDRECGFEDAEDLGLIANLQFDADPASYGAGEDVGMTLVLQNCAGVDVQLFYESEARYDFSVEDSVGQEVWRWTEEQDLLDEPGELTIEPLEKVEYSVTWDQRDFSDDQVEAGVYKVHAFSLGCGVEVTVNCEFGPVELMEIVE